MVNILFHEEQKFSKNLLWLLMVLVPVLFFWIVLSYQLITGNLVGDKPIANLPLSIITLVYSAVALWCLASVKLTTIINAETISYGWNVPTNDLNIIHLKDIREWSVVTYKFVGYGYRISRFYGTVYNAKGNIGLQLIKKSGEKILIGTLREEELRDLIAKMNLF